MLGRWRNIINCWRWDYEKQLLVPFEEGMWQAYIVIIAVCLLELLYLISNRRNVHRCSRGRPKCSLLVHSRDVISLMKPAFVWLGFRGPDCNVIAEQGGGPDTRPSWAGSGPRAGGCPTLMYMKRFRVILFTELGWIWLAVYATTNIRGPIAGTVYRPTCFLEHIDLQHK